MNGMTLELALKNELMTTVRLATGGVCSLAGLGLDDSEDCKVCVTESLLLLKHRGYLSAEIRYGYEDGFEISIEGKSGGGEKSSPAEDEISVALLNALAQNVTMEKRNGELCKVAFRFGTKA